jgi:hypothetical protein
VSNRVVQPTVALAVAVSLAACSALADNTLGGRERCWGNEDPRLATLMKGTLDLRNAEATHILDTPEGDEFLVTFPFMSVQPGESGLILIDDDRGTVATDGELVTVFGGLGGDGVIVVCAIEERHPS